MHPESLALPLDRDRCRLIAPFERDPREWPGLEWRDLYTGHSCRVQASGSGGPGVAVATSIAELVDEYWNHTEGKSDAPEGGRCLPETRGLLQHRPVTVASITPIGKETNRLVEAEEGTLGDVDDLVLHYRDAGEGPRSEDETVWRAALQALTSIEVARLATRLGISTRSLWRHRAGDAASPKHRRLLGRWCRGQ